MSDNKKLIISNDDMLRLKKAEQTFRNVCDEIANKYGISSDDCIKLLSINVNRNIRHQIRFSVDELEIIDNRAAEYNMSRSEYCRRCLIKFMEERAYINLDIPALKKDSYKSNEVRDIRIAISFDDPELYLRMKKLSKELSIQLSSLIRCVSLTTIL